MERAVWDLLSRNQLFVYLIFNGYDIRDKERFRKMNQLIDELFKPMPESELRPLIKGLAPHFRWDAESELIIDAAINMYFSPSKYKQQKELIRFIKASVKLFYRIDEVLNRMDVLGAAFLLRMCEYDIYTERITADLSNPELSTIKKLKDYILCHIRRGDSKALNVYGYWGQIENAYNEVSVLTIGDESDDGYWIEPKPQRGRPRKMVKLRDRIAWGAKRIHKLIDDYKKHYKHFYT
jgi:hypothetical protein